MSKSAEESKRITDEKWLQLSSREKTTGKAVFFLGKVSKTRSEMDWNWRSHWGATTAKVQFSKILDGNSELDLKVTF